MVDYVVHLALKTISNLLIEEAKFLGSVKDQAELLQGDLGLMQWFLKDAQGKKVDKIRIQEWVTEFREIAYDTEDVLESYAFNIGSRRQGRGVLTMSFNRWARILSETWLKHHTGLQFKALHMRISNLKHNFEIYGLRAIMEGGGGSSLSGTRQQLRLSYSHVMEADFVGLESDVEMLVQHLVGKQYRFVSIFGMGGLGKTTLAQKIYNHPQVKRHFNESCWICISQEWQTFDILQNLLTKIVPNKREEIVKYREDELVRKLFDAQKGKKFIFVLDDAWETNVWESIRHAIHKNSKILLTTRNKGVAIRISPNGFHHQPRLLNEGECLELLQKKAFLIPRNDKDHGITSEDFETLGRGMVIRCGGLPLAVVVLGGILATKHSRDEWQIVHENIEYVLGKGKGNTTVLEEILALSYDDLPHRLKPCFLYMASFPEDVSINAEMLYHMWMAEGLVSMEDKIGEGEVLINVAERYLGELVERSMVQVEAKMFPMIIKFESCRLHDIMRELCIKKAREENFIQSNHVLSTSSSSSSASKIRRVSMTVNGKDAVKPDYFWLLPAGGMENRVRSLQLKIIGANRSPSLLPLIKAQLKDCKLLRVLVIDGLHSHEKERISTMWASIVGKNISHLRFLNLRRSTFLTVLATLGKLEHLQTLNLRDVGIISIPTSLLYMSKLRYLYLPKDKVNLNIPFRKNVLRLHKLDKLEVLENFDTFYCEVKDLSKLTNLVKLKARAFINHSSIKDIIIGISKLRQLKHLSIKIIGMDAYTIDHPRPSFDCILNKLLRDPSIFTRALKVLKLNFLVVQEDSVGTLEKLPNLQKLHLKNCTGAREVVCHSGGFPQLKWLQLRRLLDLEKWRVDEGAMPNLLLLTIRNCKKLKFDCDRNDKFMDTVQVVNGPKSMVNFMSI